MKHKKISIYEKIISKLLVKQSNQLSETRKTVAVTAAKHGLPPPPSQSSPPNPQPETIETPLPTPTPTLSSPKTVQPMPSNPQSTSPSEYPELQQILRDNIKHIPECKTIAYVDISKSELLAIEVFKPLPDSVRPLVAAATSDLFNAPNVILVSNLFKEHKGKDLNKSNFHEIILHGDQDTYVFIRSNTIEHHVVVFACRNNVSSGMILHHVRNLMYDIEESMRNV